MYTLTHKRIVQWPRVHYLHAATTSSGVLNNPNTLRAQFSDRILPEDTIIMDATTRVLEKMQASPDVELTRTYAIFQQLSTTSLNSPSSGVPTAWNQGNIAEILWRFNLQNISLSSLRSAYDELVEAGWTWEILDNLWTSLDTLSSKFPGIGKIQTAYQNLEIALNQHHRVTDMHSELKVLTPHEIDTLNRELIVVNGDATTVESFMISMLADGATIDDTILEHRLAIMKTKPGYRVLKNRASFDKRFYSYFSQALLEHANTALDITKESVFADRRWEFENIIQQNRKATQEYILSLDPTDPNQLKSLHQIFITNRRYFEFTGNTQMVNPIDQVQQARSMGQNAVLAAIVTASNDSWADIGSVRNAAIAAWNYLVSHGASQEACLAAQAMSGLIASESLRPLATPASIEQVVRTAMMKVPGPIAPISVNWDQAMRDRLSAVFKRYYPQMIAGYVRPANSSRIPGVSWSARTVDDLINAVMNQNSGENTLYYHDANPLRRTENLTSVQSATRFLGFAGEKLGEFFRSPTTQKWVQSFMGATKHAVDTVAGWAGKWATTSAQFIWNTLVSWTTGKLNSWATSAHAWSSKGREKGFLNTVGWLGKMPLRAVSAIAHWLTYSVHGIIGKWVGENVIAKWVDKIIVEWTKATYDGINAMVAKVPDGEVTDAFTWLGYIVYKAGEWCGRGTDILGNWAFNRLKTDEKTAILRQLRTGLDASGQAWYQSTLFRSVMRSWGLGTHTPRRATVPSDSPAATPDVIPVWTFHAWPSPVAPVWAPANVSASIPKLSKKSVEAMIRGLVTSRTTMNSFLKNLKALLESHSKSRLLKSAHTAAITRSTKSSPTLQELIDAAVGAL